MATRKKKPATLSRSDAPLVVVLEDLNAKFNVFGEALQGFGESLQLFRDERRSRRAVRASRPPLRSALGVLENAREIRDLQGELGDVRATATRIETTLATKVNRDEQ